MKNFLITAITVLAPLCPAFAESGGGKINGLRNIHQIR